MAHSISFGLKSFSVSKPLQKSDPLLDQVTAYVKKGGITAILGASGSGKSVLLQAVSGRECQPCRLCLDVVSPSAVSLAFI